MNSPAGANGSTGPASSSGGLGDRPAGGRHVGFAQTPNASGGLVESHGTENEFGVIKETVLAVDHELSSEEETAEPMDVKMAKQEELQESGAIKVRSKYRMLGRRLKRRRWLRQYFQDGNLVREVGLRKVGFDELFLDLIMVANIAILGHKLRESAVLWDDVQKFLVLFAVIWCSWRNMAMVWNLFSSHADVFEKFFVFVVMASLCGVGVSANNAFDATRNYASVFSFLAIFLPALAHVVFSWREPVMKNPSNVINHGVFTGLAGAISAVVYLGILFTSSKKAIKAIYWAGLILNLFSVPLSGMLYRRLHRNRPSALLVAVNIEAYVEKHALLTLIFLGESLVSILFEAAEVFINYLDRANIGRLYISAFLGVAMTYSLMTLYFNVDNLILRGGLHGIRSSAVRGLIWSNMHFLYQIGLTLAATGLGLALRATSVGPEEEAEAVERMAVGAANAGEAVAQAGGAAVRKLADFALNAVVRAEEAGEGEGHLLDFTTSMRWVFAVGWGGALLTSGIMALLHFSGPRAATLKFRLPVRFAVAIGLMVGLPLWSELSPFAYIAIYSITLIVMMLVETVLVEMDRIGWWRSESRPTSVSGSQEMVDPDLNDNDILNDLDDLHTLDFSRLKTRRTNRLVPDKELALDLEAVQDADADLERKPSSGRARHLIPRRLRSAFFGDGDGDGDDDDRPHTPRTPRTPQAPQTPQEPTTPPTPGSQARQRSNRTASYRTASTRSFRDPGDCDLRRFVTVRRGEQGCKSCTINH